MTNSVFMALLHPSYVARIKGEYKKVIFALLSNQVLNFSRLLVDELDTTFRL